MKDVAAMAGVSLSTVSRVVAGNPPVARDLAAKVERAIELLGYRHNHTAGTLRRSNRLSASIGLIFEDVANPFFAAIHRGVEEVARERSVVTFAGSSDADPEREREMVEGVLARRVDGLILVPTAHDHSYLVRDVAAGIGLVFVDRPPETIDADHVLADNRGGARTAVEHLLAHGHTRIAYVGAAPQGLYTAAERLAGYREALAGRGEEVVVHGDVEPLLSGPERPTAVFSAQNLVTVDVLRTLHRLGLQHEIAHVGYDDILLAGSVEPALTVVAQDALGLGHAAAELLFSRLDGFSGRARKVVLPTTLLQRGSGERAPTGSSSRV
jgi:LacI family transcriptional regulator